MSAIIVKPSAIHGLGVFAARDIRAGEVVIDWTQCIQKLRESDLATLSVEARKRVSMIDGAWVMFKPPACYVNHSCAPNACGENSSDVARRDIREGEEITVDYISENVPDLNLACQCGSSACRGMLVSAQRAGR